ncbi:MAG: hypothetical protein QXI22_09305, partial [Sulfolobales archaeon]
KAIRIGNFMARVDGNATCEAIVDLVLKAARSEKLSSNREAGSILYVRREPTNDSGSTATIDLPQIHGILMQAMINA